MTSPADESLLPSLSISAANGVEKTGDGCVAFDVATGVGNCVVNGVLPGLGVFLLALLDYGLRAFCFLCFEDPLEDFDGARVSVLLAFSMVDDEP